MKNTLVIKVIIILFLSFSSHSKQTNVIGGMGLMDCIEVMDDWHQSDVFKRAFTSYIHGALSGMFFTTNSATTTAPGVLTLLTINYCKQNPTSKLIHAIEETFQMVAEPRK